VLAVEVPPPVPVEAVPPPTEVVAAELELEATEDVLAAWPDVAALVASFVALLQLAKVLPMLAPSATNRSPRKRWCFRATILTPGCVCRTSTLIAPSP
jgi:hypothetical protein